MSSVEVRRSRRHLPLALCLAACVLLSRGILIRAAHSESSDDDYHLVRGLEFLNRDPGLVHRELNDPPLGEALAALPLWLMGGTTHGVDEGTALYAQSAYTPETALMAVSLWKSLLTLPLIAVAFCWARRLYGLRAAWFAAAILLVEPTIAAHAPLASLDVLGTTGILTACYLGWRFFDAPTVPRLLAASAACAAALLLKHTAVLVPPILCTYAALAWFARRRARETGEAASAPGSSTPVHHALPKALFLTLFFLWVFLFLDLSPYHRTGAGLPGGLYVKSVLDAAAHVAEPNTAYLWGQSRRGGWWYYFPAVATYKVPLGLAALTLLGLISFVRARPRPAELGLLIPVFGYTAFLMLQSINIGWRHFLPAYVFLLLVACRFVATAGRSTLILAWLAVALTAVDVARWHPDYVAYVNLPRDDDVALAITDSNLDWGQGLKQASLWLDAHRALVANRPVYLRGVGVSNRAVRHYLGRAVTQLHPADAPPRTGILILSPVSLTGVSESDDEYAFLRDVAPSAIIGHTLRVYDLDRLPHH